MASTVTPMNNRPFRIIAPFAMMALAAVSVAQSKSEPGKLSGLVFGDLYTIPSHNNNLIQGRSGLNIRRVYLTYDKKIDDRFSTRIRIEANGAGDYKSENLMQPYFKDLYLQYNGKDNLKVLVGLIPTPSWSWVEDTLGYRPVEKTPLDLWRMADARDQGIAVKGTDSSKNLFYHLMYGTTSGVRGHRDKGTAFYGSLGYKLSPELTIEGYADTSRRFDKTEWNTLAANLVYKKDALTAGLTAATQNRKPAGGGASTTIGVTSLYLDYKVNDRIKPFARVDILNAAVPGADKIPYLVVSALGKPTLYILGFDYKINENFHIMPNVESISYRQAGAAVRPGNDTTYRLTFYIKF